jgi:hypothetical protein
MRQDLGESGADCVTAFTFNNSLHKQQSIFVQHSRAATCQYRAVFQKMVISRKWS